MTKAKITIEPAARYKVTMLRPVRAGLALYRPDQDHEMTGATVLAVLAAAGATPDQSAEVLTLEAIG